MSDAPGNELLRDARRLEMDAAIGLAVSVVCCLIGLPLGLWNLRRVGDFIAEMERRQCSLDVQARAFAARSMAIATIVLSIGITAATVVWALVYALLS